MRPRSPCVAPRAQSLRGRGAPRARIAGAIQARPRSLHRATEAREARDPWYGRTRCRRPEMTADKGRILIVDDEPNARSALSELLREDGYVTEVAADGQAALHV